MVRAEAMEPFSVKFSVPYVDVHSKDACDTLTVKITEELQDSLD